MIEKKINTSESSDSISEEEMLRRLGITENNLAGFSDLKVVPDPDEGGFVVSYPTCPDALPAVTQWKQQSLMLGMQKPNGLLRHRKKELTTSCLPETNKTTGPVTCSPPSRTRPSGDFSRSEFVHISLTCKLFIRIVVVRALGEHIVDQTDREQIKIADTDAQLDTPEHEQRRCHFPLTAARFFLASTCVCTFKPHSSISWGRIW